MGRNALAEFTEFVLEQLADLPEVVSKRMFGGVGLYQAGTFFAVIDDQTLYFKVDDTTRPTYEAAGMGPFQPTPQQTLKSYYQVPVEVLEDAELLTDWARQAVQVALAVNQKPARRKQSSPRS